MGELQDWLRFYRDLGIEDVRFGAGAASAAGSPSRPKHEVLAEWARYVSTCTICRLHAEGRGLTVFADCGPEAELMFLGEGPGA